MHRNSILTTTFLMSLVMCVTFPSVSFSAPTSVDVKGADLKNVDRSQLQQDEEQQLEKLKTQGKNVAVTKSQVQAVSTVNGHSEAVSQKETKVQDPTTGQTLSRVQQETVESQKNIKSKPDQIIKTVVDIPSKDLHQTFLTHNGKNIVLSDNSKETNEEDYTPFEGIQYTPADMAEYIFRTGDEDGVTLAIEELMREGLLSQDDAISYLEEVKMNLEMLRAQDEKTNRMRAVAAHRAAIASQESREQKSRSSRLHQIHPLQMSSDYIESQSEEKRMALGLRQSSIEEAKRQQRQKMESYRRKGSVAEEDLYEVNPEVDYEDVVERLRLADFLSKEFSLEEVIYQLAKQMFAQSVIKGSNDAEEALQRFASFLQQETARGRISPELQRKVIDVLLAALMDTIGEHPELAAMQPGLVTPERQSAPLVPSTANAEENIKPGKINAKQDVVKGKNENQEQLTQEKIFGSNSDSSTSNQAKSSTAKKTA